MNMDLAVRFARFWGLYLALDFRRKNPHLNRYSVEVSVHRELTTQHVLKRIKYHQESDRLN